MRRRVLWLDATANLLRTADLAGIRRLLELARDSGLTTVVVDVKPTSGEVLYPSDVAPVLGGREGRGGAVAFDRLEAAVTVAREVGLELFASVNVFVEGVVLDGRLRGAILLGERKDWEVVAQRPDGSITPLTQVPGERWAFVNPADPDVQHHELAVIEEIVRRYPVAGIILDRARYPGMVGDFSETTRRLLEREVGERITRWPQAVFEYSPDEPGTLRLSSGAHVRPGPYLGAWLHLRARTIKEFIQMTRRRLGQLRSDALLGVYAGSWYPIYYELGVNWANPEVKDALEAIEQPVRSLLSETYTSTGYAPDLDLFISGNYYPDVLVAEAGEKPFWMTVQGAAEMVSRVTGRIRPVYGGLYLEQYRDRPGDLARAIRVCLESSDGVMLFDTCHIEQYGWWDLVARALQGGGAMSTQA